jgi:DNA modification methylase
MNPQTEVKINFPQNCNLIHYAAIDQSARARNDFGDLQALADSIRLLGLIHPPTVTRNSAGEVILIAGGRRIAAMRMLGLEEIPVVFRESLADHEIAELEAEENFQRLNMKWQERALLIARTHELKVKAAVENSESWGMRETGALMGVGHASVSHCHQIREFLIKNDPEICAAPSIKAAYDILLKRREDEAVRISAQFTVAPSKVSAGFVNNFKFDDLLKVPSEQPTDGTPPLDPTSPGLLDELLGESPAANTILEKKEFPLSQMFFLGDSIQIMAQLQPESIDHVVTDIPYGIEMDNLERIKNLDQMVATHDVDQNVNQMRPFLEQAYRLIKPNGFCVFWYDLDHHEKLQQWAQEVGFTTQRWPIVWHKLHPCLNNAATKNFTKNVEFAMVCRKGNASLIKPQTTTLVAADNTAERKMYDNPFAKPSSIWRFIYEAIAYKGQVILDPFLGEGSASLAAIDLGLTPFGIEIDENRFNRAIVNIRTKLTKITNNQATFS